jgi:ribosomal protein S18 acetylase RimI-like enzyme
MSNILIREATEKDIETLLVFEQGIVLAERPFDPTLKKAELHYYDFPLMIASSDIRLVLAEKQDTIIGSGYARIEKAKHYVEHPVHAYLGCMYVDPTFRGQSVNKLIIADLQKWSATKGVKELRLDVYANNISAISAYEKFGFKKHMIEMRLGPDYKG